MLLNREPNFFYCAWPTILWNFLTTDFQWEEGGGVINGGTVLILVSDEISSLWIWKTVDVWMSLDEKHFFCPKDT